ncbi:MAG: hypothetical protein M3077_11555 [Candidatus Dormibacteraeota bacterium]|nr:hypothetical protein [Candidatus Dormibacteraeota bacterium]
MIRGITAVAVSATLLTACATTPGGPTSTAPKSGYVLYARNAQLGNAPIDVIDAATGRVERSLPVGTPSTDWSRLYAAKHDNGRTSLQAIDVHTAQVASQISFNGWFDLPMADPSGLTGGLSPNGKWLALQSSGHTSETSFMLVSTGFDQHPRQLTIRGDFDFDAISNDGQRLYLIESLAKSQPGHYRVRRYDVALGALDPHVIVDKREIASASMTGTRISGVFAPDGGWQYSLYINEKTGPFIHALNLDQTFAWCIDLPSGGTRDEQMMWSLAIEKDGRALFAVNPTLGKVARVDITSEGPSNEVSSTRSFNPARLTSRNPGFFTDAYAKGIQIGSAALTKNERTLIANGDGGSVAIDVPHLTLDRPLLSDPGIESVVMSDDGTVLFASSWNGPALLEVDPASGVKRDVLHTDTAWVLFRAASR